MATVRVGDEVTVEGVVEIEAGNWVAVRFPVLNTTRWVAVKDIVKAPAEERKDGATEAS